MLEKVKHPERYYTGADIRSREALSDAVARYTTNYRESYYSSVELKYQSRARFGTYNLLSHGLNYPQNYGERANLERIIKQRSGERYLIGIELEIEQCERREDISSALDAHLPGRHICVSDGSLRGNALEIVTSPLGVSEIGAVAWKRLLNRLAEAGCISHDSGRCGLHVSISRRYLSEDYWRKLKRFINKHKTFFRALSRRESTNFCEFQNSSGKYRALNLDKSAVAEFRFFRGTLQPSSFIASIQLVRSLVEYTRGVQDRGGSRLIARQWLAFNKRFKLAGERAARFSELMTTAATPRPRVVLTDEQRRANIVNRILHTRGVSGEWVVSDGALTFSPYYRPRIMWGIGVTETTEAVDVEYQIDWSKSRLTQEIRTAVIRGLVPSTITIRSRYQPTEPCVVVLRYNRGGWGNRSTWSVDIERA